MEPAFIGTKTDRRKGEMNFKDGKVVGLATQWHDNGQKRFQINYKNGKEMGF